MPVSLTNNMHVCEHKAEKMTLSVKPECYKVVAPPRAIGTSILVCSINKMSGNEQGSTDGIVAGGDDVTIAYDKPFSKDIQPA